MSSSSKIALILVDIQKGFDDRRWGPRNNPNAEANAAKLLAAFRKHRAPVFHFRHCSQNPDSPLAPHQPGNEIKIEVAPSAGERVLTKQVNSCFIGTQLEEELRRQDIDTLLICGLTTDHCVSTTARMAGNLGFHTLVASDATATFDRRGPDGSLFSAQQIHDTALASLHGEFAEVGQTDELIRKVFGECG